MKATRILHQRALPRHGHREKERIEPRVVESLTDVAPGCDEQSRLFVWHGLEGRRHGASLGGSHPAVEDDDVTGGVLKVGGKGRKMILALGEQDGRTSRCERGPHVIYDQAVAAVIHRQVGVERLDATPGYRAIAAKRRLADDQTVFERPAGGLAPGVDGEAKGAKLHLDDWGEGRLCDVAWRSGQ
jgi:hypothetical protein